MKNEKIIQAIAAYLKQETIVTGVPGSQGIKFVGVLNQGRFTHAGFCQEVAAEILATIAPYLEAVVEWKPQINEIVLVDGKIEGSFRGMRAGLACIAFKGGMEMNIALDRVTPG